MCVRWQPAIAKLPSASGSHKPRCTTTLHSNACPQAGTSAACRLRADARGRPGGYRERDGRGTGLARGWRRGKVMPLRDENFHDRCAAHRPESQWTSAFKTEGAARLFESQTGRATRSCPSVPTMRARVNSPTLRVLLIFSGGSRRTTPSISGASAYERPMPPFLPMPGAESTKTCMVAPMRSGVG